MTTPSTSGPAVLRLPARSRAVPTSTRLATRRAPAAAVALLAVLLGGGVVVAAQATGHWATTGRDTIAAGSGGGAGAGRGDGSGSGAGAGADSAALPASPTDVKGWMTLQQVLDAGFPGVTEAGLRAAFAIPSTVDLATPLKELDGVVAGFDMATLREWLAAPS
jgi:hypothetical protein